MPVRKRVAPRHSQFKFARDDASRRALADCHCRPRGDATATQCQSLPEYPQSARKRRRTSLSQQEREPQLLQQERDLRPSQQGGDLRPSQQGGDLHVQQYHGVQDRPHPVELTVAARPCISLTFDIPLGFHGPLTVNLDPGQLVDGTSTPSQPPLPASIDSRLARRQPRRGLGFLDLPPEIRNEVYRLVFVGDQRCRIRFDHPDNFSRSAALLRTCRRIAAEGSSVLYTEPEFYFRRQITRRTPLWSTASKEVGFEDIHRFLLMIGRENIAKLRTVFLLFEDATPCLNPRLKTADDRRYTRDKHLLASIKLLIDHGRLRVLRLGFFGRRAISPADTDFIALMKELRSDTVEVLVRRCHPDWPVLYSNLSWPKIHFELAVDIKATILRQAPFYDSGPTIDAKQPFAGQLLQPTMCDKCGEVHIGAKAPERKIIEGKLVSSTVDR